MAILFPDPDASKERIDGAAGQCGGRPYAYASRDPRALRILAKTIYREMRAAGLTEEDLMSVASEMLSLVAGDMRDRRNTVDTHANTPANAPANASANAPRATSR